MNHDVVLTEECPICLEVFQKKGAVLLHPCLHRYHQSCIREWFISKNSPVVATCPECTEPVQGLVKVQWKHTDTDGGSSEVTAYTAIPMEYPEKKRSFRFFCCWWRGSDPARRIA